MKKNYCKLLNLLLLVVIVVNKLFFLHKKFIITLNQKFMFKSIN